MMEGIARRLTEHQIERPWAFLVAMIVLSTVIAPGAMNIDIKPSTEDILPADDPAVERLDTLRSEFRGDTTYIVIEADDVRRPSVLAYMERLESLIEREENVGSVRSPLDRLDERPSDLQEAERVIESGPLVSDGFTMATMAVTADTQADAFEIESFVTALQQDIRAVEAADPAVETSLTGYNVIDRATFQMIIADFTTITGVSFGAVLVVLALLFRDLRKMVLPLVTVIIGLVWMMGLGGYMGADLTVISMVAAAMIMGLGIDFGIHVTKKYWNTGQGREGLIETMVALSRGLLGGSVTTGVGFIALLAAQLEGMHSLGIFLFTGILSTYVGTIMVLPPLITIFDEV
jgi:predicted RND superfamily exporter protein